MTAKTKSVLVITSDKAMSDSINAGMVSDQSIHMVCETSTLAGMNGRVVDLSAKHDIIVFETNPDDEAEISAIRALAAAKHEGTILVALADGKISLSQARALNNAGVDEVLPYPVSSEDVGQQLSRIGRSHHQSHMNSGRAGKIIAVAQARGGAGSTTVAVNLADQLAIRKSRNKKEAGAKVALIDFDLQFGSVGSFLDLGEQDTLHQIAIDGTIPDANFLQQSMVTMPSGLSVLGAPSKFAPLDSLRPDQVAAILDTLRESHDYIVVDLPRALVNWIEPIVNRSDELIVVTDTSVPSVRHCRRLIDFFTADNLNLPIEIVINHERKPWLQSRLHREAAKALDRKLNHWLPHDPRAASTSADRGQPLSKAAPRSPLGKAMSLLAKNTMSGLSTSIHSHSN
ncbi:MAG: AAA family ATPase [Albidovulum sp.]